MKKETKYILWLSIALLTILTLTYHTNLLYVFQKYISKSNTQLIQASIPLYPNAENRMDAFIHTVDGSAHTIRFTSHDKQESVVKFYRDTLPKGNWIIESINEQYETPTEYTTEIICRTRMQDKKYWIYIGSTNNQTGVFIRQTFLKKD
jgi:hypothetical protein